MGEARRKLDIAVAGVVANIKELSTAEIRKQLLLPPRVNISDSQLAHSRDRALRNYGKR